MEQSLKETLSLRDKYYYLKGQKKYAPKEKLQKIEERIKVIEEKLFEKRKSIEEENLKNTQMKKDYINKLMLNDVDIINSLYNEEEYERKKN